VLIFLLNSYVGYSLWIGARREGSVIASAAHQIQEISSLIPPLMPSGFTYKWTPMAAIIEVRLWIVLW